MPLYDYECLSCKTVFEKLAGVNETVYCPNCDFESKRLISVPGVNCSNDDAEWIRSVTEVVDKEGGPAAQQFLKNPTRTNYKAWMRAEGLRHWEKGERQIVERSHDLADTELPYRDEVTTEP